jgi:hypothetical protein
MSNATADVELKLGDKTLFGNDAGEDEDIEVLTSYFVNQPAFDDFLDSSVRLQVARARKGMGKSALLSKFAHDLAGLPTTPLIVHVVPSTLTGMLEPPDTENSTILENYWKQVICRAVGFEIAKAIGFAYRDDAITLVENAELAGFKGRSLIGALTSRLLGKITVLGAIEIKNNPVELRGHDQVLKRIQEEARDARDVWFLLDDLDTKYQNVPAQQAYVSSFFSACRSLIREIKGISIRATVRSDVWTSLRGAEDLDKFEQYVCDIAWSTAQQKDIIVKRIYAYVKRNHGGSHVATHWSIEKHADDFIELAFARRLKWGDSAVPAINILRIFSGGRPRWMAQLCRLAGNRAAVNKSARIGASEINEVMADFGKRRLADLYKEHLHQFQDLKKVVEAFSNGERRYRTDDLVNHITKTYLRGKSIKSVPEVDGAAFRDSMQIAHFLFKCGFVVGHNLEKATQDSPEFVTYDMRPDLLQVDTNLDDGMDWEIQASYRKALRIR